MAERGARTPEVGREGDVQENETARRESKKGQKVAEGVRFESEVEVIVNVEGSQGTDETRQQQGYEVKAAHEIGEVLFLASIGNLPRLQAVLQQNGVDISSEKSRDYDKRTALHVAADNGNYAVVRHAKLLLLHVVFGYYILSPSY